ncbi:hypothetical protein DERP_004072 [Dermatophagoides pteronyssinus]|uniref:Uncharacterized protein n=1 Tax=Dermatophagoides pteronyssinus TaxID=6956 RepID=A0ABQ8J834_DERPT|nr:hypothetical protein DERP_004072 [Dermatophagoides pteronyssinus]
MSLSYKLCWQSISSFQLIHSMVLDNVFAVAAAKMFIRLFADFLVTRTYGSHIFSGTLIDNDRIDDYDDHSVTVPAES